MDNLQEIASEIRRLSSEVEDQYEFPGIDRLFSILEKREEDALRLNSALEEGRRVAELVQEAMTLMRAALDEDSQRSLIYPAWDLPNPEDQTQEQTEGESKQKEPILKLVKRR